MIKDNEKRNVSIMKDADGNKIALIHEIIFSGKRNINWEEVECYLKKHVGEFYVIEETKDVVYLGKDLPDEYAHSRYTSSIKGGNAKAKANAVQGIGKMLEIAANRSVKSNTKQKHMVNAANGWHRYESRFGVQVYKEDRTIERYNIFHVYMIIRHDKDGKKYLYDVINIKKETSTPLGC